MEQKFDFVEVTLEPEDYNKVKEVIICCKKS